MRRAARVASATFGQTRQAVTTREPNNYRDRARFAALTVEARTLAFLDANRLNKGKRTVAASWRQAIAKQESGR